MKKIYKLYLLPTSRYTFIGKTDKGCCLSVEGGDWRATFKVEYMKADRGLITTTFGADKSILLYNTKTKQTKDIVPNTIMLFIPSITCEEIEVKDKNEKLL